MSQSDRMSLSAQQLRAILNAAAMEGIRYAEQVCRGGTEDPDAVAWAAAHLTQRGLDLLPARAENAIAPIAWAIHELIEWADHQVRWLRTGERECRAPLTWWPSAPGVGTPTPEQLVEECLALLVVELVDYGVEVTVSAVDIPA
jgi:hypothetical protein